MANTHSSTFDTPWTFVCKGCGALTTTAPRDSRRLTRQWCSRACRVEYQRRLRADPEIIEASFWAKVRKTDTCWIWTASTRNKGYGAFVYVREGRLIHGRAHRYAYELHRGRIPDDLCVLHNCPGGDNPACVNPAHLWLGTKAENNADLVAKGRHVKGGTYTPGKYLRGEEWYLAHGKTPQLRHYTIHRESKFYDYAAIQDDRFVNHLSYPQLAKKYGCSISHAHRICRKERNDANEL